MECSRGLRSAACLAVGLPKAGGRRPSKNLAEFRVGTDPSRARVTEADPTHLERSVFRIFGPS